MLWCGTSLSSPVVQNTQLDHLTTKARQYFSTITVSLHSISIKLPNFCVNISLLNHNSHVSPRLYACQQGGRQYPVWDPSKCPHPEPSPSVYM